MRLNLRNFLAELFKSAGLSVHYFRAPAKAQMPYVVFELREITNEQRFTRYILELNAYGHREAELEGILDTIEGILHYEHFQEDELIFSAFRMGSRQDIEEPEPNIWRKRLQIEIRKG